jgi:hypothetical protein
MTKMLKSLGATGNNPDQLSASRVTLYVAVVFYMVAALYVLLAGAFLPSAPVAAEGEALPVVRGLYANAEGAARLVFDKMWVLLAPYFGSLFRDGAVRVADKIGNGGGAEATA